MDSFPPSTVVGDYGSVLKEIGNDGLPRIILAGQAVNIWANQYLEVEPELAKYLPFTSKDLDLYGADKDLYDLARKTGFQIVRPEKGEPTPIVGRLLMPRQGSEPIKIEILHGLHGISSEEIQKNALLIEDAQGNRYRVLDPITVLKAKTHNAVSLPQDRRDDVKHMNMMVLAVRGFLREQVQNVESKKMSARSCLKAFEKLLYFVQSEIAVHASKMHGIAWKDTIPFAELSQAKDCKLRNLFEKSLPRSFPKF